MNLNMRSLLCGAAVAAFVIAPTMNGFGQTAPHAPPAPTAAAPTAPPAPPAHPAPPAPPSNANWQVAPVRSFNASSVKLEDIVGTLTVAVKDSGPMTVEVAGVPNRVKHVTTSQEGGLLIVDGTSDEVGDNSVWDWRNWFNFSRDDYDNRGALFVKVTVPRGSDVNVKDLVGDATIGDTMGRLHFEAAASKAKIGHVSSAHVDIGGSGTLDIAAVTGDLVLDMGGSGKIKTGPVGSVKADIAGAADADFGPISGGLQLDIAGSGDVKVARVNGPTKMDIAGSGSVKILDGVADPFHLDIFGAGSFYFGGVAVNPHIDSAGAASVHLKAYRGKLDSEGMADVKIGD